MFRQHLFSCNCSLFPSSLTLHQQFRSPPSHPNPPTKHYKRSLKSQSTSRNRPELDQPNRLQTKIIEMKSKQNIQQQYVRPLRVQTSASPQTLRQQKKKPQIIIRLKRDDNITNTCKENSNARLHFHQQKARVISPLQSQPVNNHQTIRKVQVSPPALQNIAKASQQSAGTTLAGSLAPSLEGDRLSFAKPNNSGFKSFHTMRQQFKTKSRLSTLWDERQLKQRANSNAFGLPRLTELMSQRDEAESIYEESQDGADESRVLISCKKLMEEKQGFQAWDHTKLFDFGDDRTMEDRSTLFENINLAVQQQ